MQPAGIVVERINAGEPLLAPAGDGWEGGGAINPAVVYLERSAINDALIHGLLGAGSLEDLPDGVAAVYYRAIAAQAPGEALAASSIGLALFTPDLRRLIRRFDAPVLQPGPGRESFDYLGIEDPRITCLDGVYYMLYCGVRVDAPQAYKTRLCLAVSRDLLHWGKSGPIQGGPDRWENKDGVLFPQRIGGKYYLLHRPWGAAFSTSDLSIWLAASDSPYGPWEDYGEVLHAYPVPGWRASWVGAGSVPIAVGEGRFLVIYHTGNYLNDTDREYDMAAAIFDFTQLTPEDPHRLVVSRIEPLLRPETPIERSTLADGSRLDVVFPCGSYEYQADIYLLYGASDRYAAAARVDKARLLERLAHGTLENP